MIWITFRTITCKEVSFVDRYVILEGVGGGGSAAVVASTQYSPQLKGDNTTCFLNKNHTFSSGLIVLVYQKKSVFIASIFRNLLCICMYSNNVVHWWRGGKTYVIQPYEITRIGEVIPLHIHHTYTDVLAHPKIDVYLESELDIAFHGRVRLVLRVPDSPKPQFYISSLCHGKSG